MLSCYNYVSNREVLIIRYSSNAKVVLQRAWHAVKRSEKYIWKGSKHLKQTTIFRLDGGFQWISFLNPGMLQAFFHLLIFKSLDYP